MRPHPHKSAAQGVNSDVNRRGETFNRREERVKTEADSEVSLAIEREAVRQAVDSLPSEQRQAVELVYFGGYSQPEIAEMIRVPLSTIKGRMRLGMEKLHSYLQGRGFVYE